MSWTAKHAIGWVLNKAKVLRNSLESVKARKLTYFGHVVRSNSESLEKQIMQVTAPGSQKKEVLVDQKHRSWCDQASEREND